MDVHIFAAKVIHLSQTRETVTVVELVRDKIVDSTLVQTRGVALVGLYMCGRTVPSGAFASQVQYFFSIEPVHTFNHGHKTLPSLKDMGAPKPISALSGRSRNFPSCRHSGFSARPA
ncbi:hypothetical protein LCGC14_1259660 [marine sediment metagenome]|uniref:Uncharacterized protein n=2 Tax=root TaxID=1 RepID=A0A831VNR7_9FLAO|nr:hypothetical protein [Pricia sp.]HEA21211.1 hypothetical protein [Pricia antarctica]